MRETETYSWKSETFSKQPPMIDFNRAFHTTTPLPDIGKFLITGGYIEANSSCLNDFCLKYPDRNAQLYDPISRNFTPIFHLMLNARAGHTATRLANGKVLIAGGGDTSLGTADLYDPLTEFFTSTGSMTTNRKHHTATLLKNKKVLIAGGLSESGYPLNTAELYDPATKTFTRTGDMTEPRAFHTATLLPDGLVLITGGKCMPEDCYCLTADLYNPVTGTFTRSSAVMGERRAFHAATLLPDDTVLITGGETGGESEPVDLDTAELFVTTPQLEHFFIPTDSMGVKRKGHTATLLPNGVTLIAGGGSRTAEFYLPNGCGPFIGEISPNMGPAGTYVHIRGNNFRESQSDSPVTFSTVTFNGISAADVRSWSDSEIIAIVPPGDACGPLLVTVDGVASNALIFACEGIDLVETAISAPPETAQPGGSFSVSDTVQNRGSVTSGKTTTRYYLSKDKVKNTGDKLLTNGRRSVPSLPMLKYSSGSVDVTVPSTIKLDTYYLLACADNLRVVVETDETNNCIASTTTVEVSGADLIETAVSNPPGTLKIGDTFPVWDTVLNDGMGAASGSTTRYYLSKDTLKGSDTLLEGSRGVPELAHDGTSTGTIMVTISKNTGSPGTYYLLACADYEQVVVEFNETNNCIASTTTVQVSGADLIETTVDDPPDFITIGETFPVSDTVKNEGIITSGQSTTRYYLSVDKVKDEADTRLNGSRPVNSLGPGATSPGTVNVSVPSIEPGTYYLLACSDDMGQVSENDETNNCIASSGTIDITKGPDLVEIAVSNNLPSTMNLGESLPVFDTVRNQGTLSSGESITRYYLSTDPSWDYTDTLLTGSRPVTGLPTEGADSGNATVTIPSMALGTYYLLVCADDMKVVAETNETNNCISSSAQMQILAGPDLIETEVSDPPSTAIPGVAFLVKDTVKNQGNAPANKAFTTLYYLKKQGLLAKTVSIGSRNISKLPIGESSSAQVYTRIPTGTAAGTYYLWACADKDGVVAETSETNNCISSINSVDVSWVP